MQVSRLCLAAVCLIGLLSTANAEDTEKVTIRSSLSKNGDTTPCLGACTINFRQELKVPFDFLDSIGSRIHEARKLPDPVALAVAANSLAVAETVAGKTAKVTSQDVMKEAVELAKLRGEIQELKAVALLVADKKLSNELNQLAQAIADSQPEAGETSKELIGDLHVTNHTSHDLKIYMDGRYLGYVHSGRSTSFHVHNHRWHNHFDAYCADDGDLIRHGDYEGHSHHLDWHIDE